VASQEKNERRRTTLVCVSKPPNNTLIHTFVSFLI